MAHVIGTAGFRGLDFIRRQERDFKVIVLRQALNRFVYQLTVPYESIYTVGLGANPVQLGFVNSFGLGISALVAPFSGWLADRINVKLVFLMSLGVFTMAPLVYALADYWTVIVLAMMFYYLGMRTSTTCCSVVCATCLSNPDRATGMSLCMTLGSALVVASPMLGAWVVTAFGGVSVEGIRPLYYVRFVGTAAMFLLIATQLSAARGGGLAGSSHSAFFRDFADVFRQGRDLKRWVAIASLTWLPWAMIQPFTQVYAYQVKGAEQWILGLMVAASAATTLLLAIPMGRFADSAGRKRTLYILAPLFWASNLVLVLAPNAAFVVLAGLLQGFYMITTTTTNAMSAELVPGQQIGRWLGTLELFRGLVAVPAPLLGGLIWRTIGPEWLFMCVIAIDAFVRIPLLLGMHETLERRF